MTTKQHNLFVASCATARHRKKPENHGMSHSPEYKTWSHMIDRCHNPKCKLYPRYGGRGISVCDRWHNSFLTFLADIGHRPTPKHSIDRIDNDGNYEPGNCRWATYKEQNQNMRGNHIILFHGRSQCLQAWADEAGLKRGCLRNRLNSGIPMEQAMQTAHRRMRLVECGGKIQSISQWARETGISERTISRRLANGWTAQETLAERTSP